MRDRTQARLLRSHASELVAYLRALEEQKVRRGVVELVGRVHASPQTSPSTSAPHDEASAAPLSGAQLVSTHPHAHTPPRPARPCPPQTIIAATKGADPDKPIQRAATARFVGLTVPEGIPLGAPVAPGKYAASLAARLSGADPLVGAQLEGAEFLKAQLYGVRAVLEERRAPT